MKVKIQAKILVGLGPLSSKASLDLGSRLRSAGDRMPPGEIDPSRLPGVIPYTGKRVLVEDMSSDDDAVDAFGRGGAKQAKGKLGANDQPAPKAKAARGEGARGAPKGNPPKAAGHVAAAPTAVPRGQPAKRPSPMRPAQRDHQLRVAPAPSKRRRSLSGEVSAAPAAASSSPALPVVGDAYLHNMLQKRCGRGCRAIARV